MAFAGLRPTGVEMKGGPGSSPPSDSQRHALLSPPQAAQRLSHPWAPGAGICVQHRATRPSDRHSQNARLRPSKTVPRTAIPRGSNYSPDSTGKNPKLGEGRRLPQGHTADGWQSRESGPGLRHARPRANPAAWAERARRAGPAVRVSGPHASASGTARSRKLAASSEAAATLTSLELLYLKPGAWLFGTAWFWLSPFSLFARCFSTALGGKGSTTVCRRPSDPDPDPAAAPGRTGACTGVALGWRKAGAPNWPAPEVQLQMKSFAFIVSFVGIKPHLYLYKYIRL